MKRATQHTLKYLLYYKKHKCLHKLDSQLSTQLSNVPVPVAAIHLKCVDTVIQLLLDWIAHQICAGN